MKVVSFSDTDTYTHNVAVYIENETRKRKKKWKKVIINLILSFDLLLFCFALFLYIKVISSASKGQIGNIFWHSHTFCRSGVGERAFPYLLGRKYELNRFHDKLSTPSSNVVRKVEKCLVDDVCKLFDCNFVLARVRCVWEWK